MSTIPPRHARRVTVTADGRRYQVLRWTGTHGPDTVTEFWPGIGLLGSQRRWLGDRHAHSLTWWAAINPTGDHFAATDRAERLASRRAAVTWLLTHPATSGTTTPDSTTDTGSTDSKGN